MTPAPPAGGTEGPFGARARLRMAEAAAYGGLGGALFWWLALPLPWLLGPMVAVAGVNLLGRRVGIPRGARQCAQITVGTIVGHSFSPAMVAVLAVHLPWMAGVALVSVALAGLGVLILRRVAGLDRASAFFGSIPGGMAEMLTLGERFGAASTALTVAQSVRVTLLVLTVPPALTYFGAEGDAVFTAPALEVRWAGLAALFAAALAVALALNRLGLPNAWMLGPCVLSAGLMIAELPLSGFPGFLSPLAQLLLGIHLGERFERDELRRMPRVVLGAALTTLAMVAVALVLALAIARLTGVSYSVMVAATAPGGLAEMSITAQVLGLSVPLVTAYHVTRVLMITLLVFPLFRVTSRLGHRP